MRFILIGLLVFIIGCRNSSCIIDEINEEGIPEWLYEDVDCTNYVANSTNDITTASLELYIIDGYTIHTDKGIYYVTNGLVILIDKIKDGGNVGY